MELHDAQPRPHALGERFPVDLNRAPKEMLLRVPGLGVTSVKRLLQARRGRALRMDDLSRLNVPLQQVLPFVTLPGHGSARGLDDADLAARLRPKPQQQSLF